MRRRELVSSVAGGLAVCVAILGVGAAFRSIQATVAALATAALVPLLLSRRVSARRSPLIVLITLATALTFLQLLPLPATMIAALDPVGSALRDDGAALMDTSPWQALSMDAPGTLRAACFLAILLAIAVVTTRLAVTERGRFKILGAIAIMCGLTAVIVGIHELLGARKLYGLYEPAQAHPTVLGPLLNENHLGALMAMGATISLGLSLYGRQDSRLRILWVAICAGCAMVALLTESRGATLALIGGAVVAGGVLVGQRLFAERRRERAPFATTSLPIGIVITAAMVLVIYVSAGGVSEELARTSFDEIHQPRSKIAIWRSSLALVEESPWVGVGRGAFEPAFTRHHPAAGLNSFSHVENEYLQAIVDWGVPGAILLSIVVGWVIVICFRRWSDGPLAAAALGVMTVAAIHGAVDFGTELLGIAAPLVAVIATASYVPLREAKGRALTIARFKIALLALALLVSAGLLLSRWTTSLSEAHEQIAPSTKVQLDNIREHIENHPLDYYGFARAAEVLQERDDPRRVLLLNHALRLHPNHPALHLAAARMLVRAGRNDQATIEYSLAIRTTSRLQPLLSEIAKRLTLDQAARAIPTDTPYLTTITKVLEDLQRPDIATSWLVRVLDVREENLEACEWLYSRAVRAKDLGAALAASARCRQAAPSYEARVRLARLLTSEDRRDAARAVVREVETWPGRIDTKVDGWLVRCDTYMVPERWEDAKRCLRRLEAMPDLNASQRRQLESRFEKVEEIKRGSSAPSTP